MIRKLVISSDWRYYIMAGFFVCFGAERRQMMKIYFGNIPLLVNSPQTLQYSPSTMQEQASFQVHLHDYPVLLGGLHKLSINTPTDFQHQLLQVSANMDHLIVTAPQGVGKRVGLLLHALRKFSNQEEGLLIVLAHSKDLSQQIHHILSVCMGTPVINLYMQDIGQLPQKAAIVGSPLQVNNLWKKQKDKIVSIVIPEADLLLGFGYGQALELLAGSLNASKVAYKLSCVSRGSEIEKFKSQWMRKASRVDYMPPEGVQEEKPKQQQITHFYGVGDKMSIPITLYLTLKFSLVNPKILILVQNLRQVYRYALFLQRTRISQVAVYNHEDPVNLRFYVLSIWLNGSTGILIATPQMLEEIKSDVFKRQSRKKFKRDHIDLVNMSAMLILGLNHLNDKYQQIIEAFHVKPLIMTFLENKAQEINKLQELIAYQKERFEHAVIKELPITRKQIEGFRYRVEDVWSGLTNHRADLFRQLDFKKKLLKTPELKEQFDANGKQRQVLVKAINDIRKKVDYNKVTISEFIPEYLVPECLKASYEEKIKLNQTKEEHVPEYHQKVKKVLRYVNLDEENPETTDVSRLKLISARKRWKLLHGFKLKKRNRRLEQKGVFDT